MNKTIATGLVAGLVATASLASGFSVQTANASSSNTTSVNVCSKPASGVLQDFYGTTNVMLVTEGMNTVQIKNTSTNCAYQVGIASYNAYERYEVSVSSQTLFASQTTVLQPGQTWTYTIAVPSCAYQVDVFVGDVLNNFKTATYTSQNRFLDGYFYPGSPSNKQLPFCTKPTVTPTAKPSVTPTVKPSVTPSVTPTVKPSVTPTVKPSVTPSVTPTATPTPSPTGEVLGSTPTPTPPAQLPSTGPGSAMIVALGGIVSALVGRKYVVAK